MQIVVVGGASGGKTPAQRVEERLEVKYQS
jgi:hypothetical protein